MRAVERKEETNVLYLSVLVNHCESTTATSNSNGRGLFCLVVASRCFFSELVHCWPYWALCCGGLRSAASSTDCAVVGFS